MLPRYYIHNWYETNDSFGATNLSIENNGFSYDHVRWVELFALVKWTQFECEFCYLSVQTEQKIEMRLW